MEIFTMARDYGSEYENYHSSKKAKQQRARNNKARRKAVREGRARKGDGKDVAHTKPGARGGTFMQDASKNRSIPRTKTARRKKQ
jgi:hypothetical protein